MTVAIIVWLAFIAAGTWIGLVVKQRPLAGFVCGLFGLLGLIVLAFLPNKAEVDARPHNPKYRDPKVPDVVGVDTDPTLADKKEQ